MKTALDKILPCLEHGGALGAVPPPFPEKGGIRSAKRGAELPPFLEQERILSIKQSAELLGVSVATFRRLYQAGKLQTIRLSERRLGCRVRDLIEHLAKRANTAAYPAKRSAIAKPRCVAGRIGDFYYE
jgi:predicted DNA-binding transcriptional regulator AlpA